jgi:hypothetical protein
VEASAVSVVRTRDVYPGDVISGASKIFFAPFRLLRWCFRGAYRVGVFLLVDVPVAAMGIIFAVCAVVVVASVVYQIFEAKVSHSTEGTVAQVSVARHDQPNAHRPPARHAQNEAAIRGAGDQH